MLFFGAGPVELDCLSDEPARESIEPLPVVMQLPDHNHGSGSLGAATFFLGSSSFNYDWDMLVEEGVSQRLARWITGR